MVHINTSIVNITEENYYEYRNNPQRHSNGVWLDQTRYSYILKTTENDEIVQKVENALKIFIVESNYHSYNRIHSEGKFGNPIISDLKASYHLSRLPSQGGLKMIVDSDTIKGSGSGVFELHVPDGKFPNMPKKILHILPLNLKYEVQVQENILRVTVAQIG